MTANVDHAVSNDHFRHNAITLNALLIVKIPASATGLIKTSETARVPSDGPEMQLTISSVVVIWHQVDEIKAR